MADSNITKRALATSLKELMAEQPFDKINVAQICERCNMNRKSFYYHFKDKYDLVNWIFDTEFLELLKTRKSQCRIRRTLGFYRKNLPVFLPEPLVLPQSPANQRAKLLQRSLPGVYSAAYRGAYFHLVRRGTTRRIYSGFFERCDDLRHGALAAEQRMHAAGTVCEQAQNADRKVRTCYLSGDVSGGTRAFLMRESTSAHNWPPAK